MLYSPVEAVANAAPRLVAGMKVPLNEADAAGKATPSSAKEVPNRLLDVPPSFTFFRTTETGVALFGTPAIRDTCDDNRKCTSAGLHRHSSVYATDQGCRQRTNM